MLSITAGGLLEGNGIFSHLSCTGYTWKLSDQNFRNWCGGGQYTKYHISPVLQGYSDCHAWRLQLAYLWRELNSRQLLDWKSGGSCWKAKSQFEDEVGIFSVDLGMSGCKRLPADCIVSQMTRKRDFSWLCCTENSKVRFGQVWLCKGLHRLLDTDWFALGQADVRRSARGCKGERVVDPERTKILLGFGNRTVCMFIGILSRPCASDRILKPTVRIAVGAVGTRISRFSTCSATS